MQTATQSSRVTKAAALTAGILACAPLILALSSAPPTQLETYREATVLVMIDEHRSGSGALFFHNKTPYILTAAHLFAEEDVITEEIKPAKIDKVEIRSPHLRASAKVVRQDLELDLALLQVEFAGSRVEQTIPALALKHFRDGVPYAKLGGQIYTIGYALGERYPRIVSGGVASLHNARGVWKVADLAELTAAPGASGGPAIDYNGKYVGVVVGTLANCYAFYVPQRVVYPWLREHFEARR